jgi:hypothetical protein
MPERSSGDQLVWFARISLMLVTAAVVYFLTWRFLAQLDLTSWLAPLWAAETLAFVALTYALILRLSAHRNTDRRRTPRVPAAIPIRYATEEGQVGIGALVDITDKGAGLLIPHISLEADRVWIQFLWFDDRIGTQGRIVHAKETDGGIRLGLELLPLHPETQKLLANFVIPFGESTARTTGSPGRRHRERPLRREPQLPVQVQRDATSTWGIAEYTSGEATTLLLPESFPQGARVMLSHWGNGRPTECEVVRWKSLKRASLGLFRVEVRQVNPL